MAGFYLFETKPLVIQLKPDGVLDGAKNVVITLQQMNGKKLEKSGQEVFIDPERTRVECFLSQEETAAFKVGRVRVQINILYEDTERDVSCQGTLEVWDNLHKEVMG